MSPRTHSTSSPLLRVLDAPEDFHLGVAVAVTDPTAFALASEVVEASVRGLVAACSRRRDGAELSRVNRRPGRAVQVSAFLAGAAEEALQAARLTDGLVSPTVGTAMRVIAVSTRPESGDPLVRISPVPGWRMVSVDREACTITVPPGVELDLEAIATALCADQAASAAAQEAGCGVLVALGNDVAAAGPAPVGGWPVEIPAAGFGSPSLLHLAMGGAATATGNSRRWAQGLAALRGRTSRRSSPSSSSSEAMWRSATVVAGRCTDAAVASRAALDLGEHAPVWLEKLGLAARLVDDAGKERLVGAYPVAQAESASPLRRAIALAAPPEFLPAS